MKRSGIKYFLTAFVSAISFFSPSVLCGQSAKIDSLLSLLKTDKADTGKLKHLNLLCWYYKDIGEFDKALTYGNTQLSLSKQLNFENGMAEAYNSIGTVYMSQGDSHKALENYLAALKIRQETGDKNGMAAVYNNIGLIHDKLGNVGTALENYSAALKINKETGNKKWLSNNYNNIGNNYGAQGKLDKALENYLASLKIKEDLKETNDPQYANIIHNIGIMYYYTGNPEKALVKFEDALKLRKALGDKSGIADSYITLGSVYFEQANGEQRVTRREQFYNKALENFIASKKMKEEIGDKYGLALTLVDIGNVFLKQNKLTDADKQLHAGLTISTEIDSKSLTRDIFQLLSQCDSAGGNWKGAYEYHKLFKQYNDSLFNEESSKKTAEMNAKFESEKKEAQISLLEKDKDKQAAVSLAENKKNRTILLSVVGCLLLVAVFSLFMFNRWRITQRQKKIIEAQKKIVDEQKRVVEEKNNSVLDSIRYAMRIQNSLLPTERYIEKNLKKLRKN